MKRSNAFLVVFLLVSLVLPSFEGKHGIAESLSTPMKAPPNPAFVQYLQDLETLRMLGKEPGEAFFGLIPSPIDRSHLKGKSFFKIEESVSLPRSYDLRTYGRVTPIRNQGSCGSCWAFATYGSLESNFLPMEEWDFSEDNLKNTHGFDWEPCEGGNADISTAYLARGSGPVTESEDPYNPIPPYYSPPGLTAKKLIQNVLTLPGREGAFDNDDIKQAVMSYGGVYTTMYIDDPSFDPVNNTHYYSGSNCPNHGVVIIGWDDDFDKSKFRMTPPGNGAFIVKNSWGADWGEDGFFYISYYDTVTGTDISRLCPADNRVFMKGEDYSPYNHIYQYDPLGLTSAMSYGSATKGWFANVFTAAASDTLAAVSFFTTSLNVTYEIRVYTNVSSGPTSGSFAASQTDVLPFPGYHTVALENPVELTAGEKFSVVVKVEVPDPDYPYPIPLESSDPGYSSRATANPGESFISSSGTSWKDITTLSGEANTNVCIKAFTTSFSETVSTPTVLLGSASGTTGTLYTFLTGGAFSDLGHDVQYLFDWGDGKTSGWLSKGVLSASKLWKSAKTYHVKVKARCAVHTSIESNWSAPLEVTITGEDFNLLIQPREGTLGTVITLTGDEFGTKKGKVYLGGLTLKVFKWENETIQCQLTKALPSGPHDVVVQRKDGATVTEEEGFDVRAPDIESIVQNHGLQGIEITVSGKFFGGTKGKAYVESKSCRILSRSINPETGEETFVFLFPKKLPLGLLYRITVSNKIGSDTWSLKIE